jgi:hypothetical protein
VRRCAGHQGLKSPGQICVGPNCRKVQSLGELYEIGAVQCGPLFQANSAAPFSLNLTKVPLSWIFRYPLASASSRPALYSPGCLGLEQERPR